jgi:chemotaxis protein CheX
MPEICGAALATGRFETYLDRAVDEVFGTMMGVACTPVEEGPASELDNLAAVIGLAGAISGSMVLHSGGPAAMRMTERMTGMAPKGVDALVRDAVGEVCNMVAGAWKGFDPVLSAGCLLSTPTVVAGRSYELFSDRSPVRIERSYRFEEFVVAITLFCETNW